MARGYPFQEIVKRKQGMSPGSLSMFLSTDSTNPLETSSSSCSLSKVEQKLPLVFQRGVGEGEERDEKLYNVEHLVQA
jgi:hypothetical protein